MRYTSCMLNQNVYGRSFQEARLTSNMSNFFFLFEEK
jgi:hypothetical protein